MINRQDFINAINKNIDMVRGDSLNFNFQLQGLGSRAEYEGLDITFTVAENYNASAAIEVTDGAGIELIEYDVTKDIATFGLSVAPNMTSELDLARYYYDLQINHNGEVITLMRGRFTVVYDVSH